MDLNNFNNHFNQAKAFVQKQNYQEALKQINFALDIIQTDPDAISFRAVVYFHLKENHLSLKDFNTAQNLDPNNPYRYSSRAFVKAAIKDYHGAVEDYQKAIELDPEDAIAHNNLGLVQEQLSYWKDAKENFKKADKLAGIESKVDIQEPINKPKRNGNSTKSNKNIVSSSEEKTTLLAVLKLLFTSSETRKEFWHFLKNGFKI